MVISSITAEYRLTTEKARPPEQAGTAGPTLVSLFFGAQFTLPFFRLFAAAAIS
jgi:hypothetical protein